VKPALHCLLMAAIEGGEVREAREGGVGVRDGGAAVGRKGMARGRGRG
jgi:hypothetical protein